jgi:hypothetical protein
VDKQPRQKGRTSVKSIPMSSGRNREGLVYDCICPDCEKDHRAAMPDGRAWSGRGVPHIFCDMCRKRQNRSHDRMPIDAEIAATGA